MIAQIISKTLGLSTVGSEASAQPLTDAPRVNERQEQEAPDTSADKTQDKVSLSDTGLKLSQVITDDQPNWQQVRTMTGQLSANMDSQFLKAGIDTSEPVRINIHPYTGIPFVGEHPDKSRIQNLLDNTPDLLEQIRNVNAVASYSYQASQAQHGLNSNATVSPGIADPSAGQVAQERSNMANHQQVALEMYEETLQTTRISMAYHPEQGIDLDVISLNPPHR